MKLEFGNTKHITMALILSQIEKLKKKNQSWQRDQKIGRLMSEVDKLK